MTRASPTVHLEPLALEHLDHVMTWVNDREVMQYFANRQTEITAEEERRYLATLLASKTDIAYSVFASDGGYVGQCSINQIYWPARNGRLFLAVTRAQQHKGFGTAALRALIERAFDKHGLHKLWLIVRRDNRDAQATYVKLGFEFEGVLRDEYHVLDRFHDMVRMGLLATSLDRRG